MAEGTTGKEMTELPLDAATQDVIARYKRGNDMLTSAARAMRRLKERVDVGEAGEEWDWPRYRATYLYPYISKAWINRQLQLAPPGATDEEIADNVVSYNEKHKEAQKKYRATSPGERLSRDSQQTDQADLRHDLFVAADSAGARQPQLDHELEDAVATFNSWSTRRQEKFLDRIGATRTAEAS